MDQPAAEQPASDPQPEVGVQPGPSEQPVQAEQPASDPQPEVAVQPGPSEQPVPSDQPAQPAQAEQPAATTIDPEPDNGKSKRWWIWPLVVLGLVIVALAVFMILGRTAPDLIDPLLYTPEELRIINY